MSLSGCRLPDTADRRASGLLWIVPQAKGDALDVGERVPGLSEFKSKEFEQTLARTSHDGAISGFVRGHPGASRPLDQVK